MSAICLTIPVGVADTMVEWFNRREEATVKLLTSLIEQSFLLHEVDTSR